MPENDLPDLGGTPEPLSDEVKRRLDIALQNALGKNFRFKNGLNYRNQAFDATLNQRGLSANSPFAGGKLNAAIANILDSPRYSLTYSKSFK